MTPGDVRALLERAERDLSDSRTRTDGALEWRRDLEASLPVLRFFGVAAERIHRTRIELDERIQDLKNRNGELVEFVRTMRAELDDGDAGRRDAARS